MTDQEAARAVAAIMPAPAPEEAPAAGAGDDGGFFSTNCDGPSTRSGECLPGSTPVPQEYPEHNIDQIPEVPGNQGE